MDVTDMMRVALATQSVVAKGTMSAIVRLARRNVDHASLRRCRRRSACGSSLPRTRCDDGSCGEARARDQRVGRLGEHRSQG